MNNLMPAHSEGRVERTGRWSRFILVLVHIPVVMFPPAYTLLNVASVTPPYTNPVPPITLCLLAGALQLRHSFATANGERPRGGVWTFLALAILAYAPLLWIGYYNWASAQALLVASAMMVFRGRLAFAVAGAIVLLAGFMAVIAGFGYTPKLTDAQLATLFVNHSLFDTLLGAFLFGAARLVRFIDELQATRSELAELAFSRERLRISRDLHDLLGQSLSAISLKGDLAIRLLSSNTEAAQHEIESMTVVARDAIRGVRAVAREEHTVSLTSEIGGAAALLAAAGIAATIDVELSELPPPVEETMAWAIREGVANILLHSAARSCSIVAARRNDALCLEIVNDGARQPTGEGHGLAGLTARARALSGTVTTAREDGGRFSLLVQIPEGGTAT